MQYFKTQEEAQKLFKAIRLSTMASGKNVVVLDTLSETATANLMADMLILLAKPKLVTERSYHKIVVKNKKDKSPAAVMHFTNANTKPEDVLGFEDIQIIKASEVIRMEETDIEIMFLVHIEGDSDEI